MFISKDLHKYSLNPRHANGYSWNRSIMYVLTWIIGIKRAAQWPIRNFHLPRTIPSSVCDCSSKYTLHMSDVWLTGLLSDITHTPYPTPWFMSLWHFVGLKVSMCTHESPGYLSTQDHTCALLVLMAFYIYMHTWISLTEKRSELVGDLFWESVLLNAHLHSAV